MELNYKCIGARIKERRKNIGMSQEQLAETVELSAKYISQIERGVRHLSLDAIANISVVLNTSVDMLLFDANLFETKENIYETKTFGDYSKNEQDAILEVVSAIKTILHIHNVNTLYKR